MKSEVCWEASFRDDRRGKVEGYRPGYGVEFLQSLTRSAIPKYMLLGAMSSRSKQK